MEDKGKLLRDNTVAYLNVDGAVSGEYSFTEQRVHVVNSL